MTTPTMREALERCDHTLTAHGHIDANTPLHDTIRAALASHVEQEPVAWRACCPKTGGEIVMSKGAKATLVAKADSIYADHGYLIEPLYAHPTPSAEAIAALKLLENADEQDWSYLFSLIPDGGRGRFWKDRLTAIRDLAKLGER